jgi:hypothetical protein
MLARVKLFLRNKLMLIGTSIACSGGLPYIVNTLSETTGSGVVFSESNVSIGNAILVIGGVGMLFAFKNFVMKEFEQLNIK